MSLVVSLRIPDGIIMAADSLATVMGQLKLNVKARGPCPKCKEDIEIPPLTPEFPMPISTLSFAQKLCRFRDDYGISAFGNSVVAGRTIAFHVRQLEAQTWNQDFSGVSEVAEKVKEYFTEQLQKELGEKLKELPKDALPFGLHVGGYDWEAGERPVGDPVAKTCEVKIGKESEIVVHQEPTGFTMSGKWQIFRTLLEKGKNVPGAQINFGAFSLQDGIDFAEFVIGTTTQYQRFAVQIPDVGGAVDIALITPHDGFQWIRQKELGQMLDQNRVASTRKEARHGQGEEEAGGE